MAKQSDISTNWILHTPVCYDIDGEAIYLGIQEEKSLDKRCKEVRKKVSKSIQLEKEILRNRSRAFDVVNESQGNAETLNKDI